MRWGLVVVLVELEKGMGGFFRLSPLSPDLHVLLVSGGGGGEAIDGQSPSWE